MRHDCKEFIQTVQISKSPLIVGEPQGHHDDEFQGQFRSGAMIRVVLGLGVFLLALFPLRILCSLGQPLAVAVQPHGDGQGKDFGRCPGREGDNQGQHDPVVSPTDQGFGATGDERVVMHAGAIEGQPAFATEGIVDGPKEGGAGGENRDDQLGQAHGEDIDVPGGVTEEAMKPRPVSVPDMTTGEDDFGHVAAALGENPACHDDHEGLIGRSGEDGVKTL